MISKSKNIYRDILIASGLEGLTLLCWYAEASPPTTTTLLALTIAADLYALQKAGDFFYNTYQKSHGIKHFFVEIDCPLVSSLWKRIPTTPSEQIAEKLLEVAENMKPNR